MGKLIYFDIFHKKDCNFFFGIRNQYNVNEGRRTLSRIKFLKLLIFNTFSIITSSLLAISKSLRNNIKFDCEIVQNSQHYEHNISVLVHI